MCNLTLLGSGDILLKAQKLAFETAEYRKQHKLVPQHAVSQYIASLDTLNLSEYCLRPLP